MRDIAFVVSQPLQILVAISIIRQLGIEKRAYLAIVGRFFNAKEVYGRMKDRDWEMSDLSLVFFDTDKEAFKFFRGKNAISALFTEGDVSVKKFFYLLYMRIYNLSLEINVFEEGIGTYKPDLYSGAKKSILDMLGVGTYHGGCMLTNCLYVFNPIAYKQNIPHSKIEVKKIESGPVEIIQSYFDSLAYIFDYAPVKRSCGSSCSIYLSSHSINPEFLEKFSSINEDRYIKLHPRAKALERREWGVLVSRTAPAEMVLMDLAKKYDTVDVFHHGSSAEGYILDKRITFKNLFEI